MPPLKMTHKSGAVNGTITRVLLMIHNNNNSTVYDHLEVRVAAKIYIQTLIKIMAQ
jgi:hypothetical protein